MLMHVIKRDKKGWRRLSYIDMDTGKPPEPPIEWFQHAPTRKGYYWVYEMGNPKDRPEILRWDGQLFRTMSRYDPRLCYKPEWSCAGPIRPPKIPKSHGRVV